jgi:hypothetical protein
MVGFKLSAQLRLRAAQVLIGAALAMALATTGSAAERVVLGEYFTNLF